ncbi:hypothetical protein ARMA_0134 [Ardenticatena maritima]|uniref:Carbohydrate kinase PfkB domain-containing protein n=1 Tax=Ardenticatena maritima TaxID=872965 RepID=A0A0M8K6C9_9CHLR|nr:PfkB family carbohydrate kinase [Ardenticatena maritima]GAP61711.1 hypothetical protein ARMA_0134 [Ardenticatena maritima]
MTEQTRLPREILVVGSVGLDNVETPFGKVERALGGSATYFATAASFFAPVNLVGIVGTDFPQEHIDFLQQRGVNLDGLEIVEGETFFWAGRYDYDLNVAHTLETRLNVFADFNPQLPPHYRTPSLLFLANIAPELQLSVLDQVERPDLVALDTMNFWIDSQKEALIRVIQKVDVVIINEAEARDLAETPSLLKAARTILSWGPRALVVKRGEYGAALFTSGSSRVDSFFFVPAYPLEDVRDPTGAGDTFAGGFIGALAHEPVLDTNALRRAMVQGSVVASFTVEDFSINRLKEIRIEDIWARTKEFRAFTYFEPLEVARS